MHKKSRLLGRWQFSTGVLAPAVLSLLVMATGVLGFVLWSTADIDAHALKREVSIVDQVIERKIAEVSHAQESIAIWDDSVRNTRLAYDHEWVHWNLGAWMYEYFGHDRIVILDDTNRPIYAMDGGASVSTAIYAEMDHDIAPLIGRLRAEMAASTWDATAGVPLPRATDLMIIGGLPAIVSIVPLVSDTNDLPQAPGTEFLHVSIVFLDATFAASLKDQYQFEDAGFATVHDGANGHADYLLDNEAGRFISFFEWQPDRPGSRMLAQTAPALALGFLIVGVIVFLLLDKLWRSSKAVEEGRRQAQYLADHDALTGLPNRALFDQRLQKVLADRHVSTRQVALLMLGLDRFKQVNDTLGHQAGDELIKAVGHRLQNLLSSSDTLARFGGDEFSVLHKLHTGTPEPMVLANRIVEALSRPFEVSGTETFIGASVGVVMIDETSTRSKVIRHADIALQEAKSGGRNRAVLFEEQMNELLQLRHTIETELREALRRPNQINVLFQPLYDRETGTISGAEALTRWHHPKFGQIPPMRFIPVAEASGLIEPLGDFVLRKACELGAKWPGKTIAINISPVQLRNPKFPARVFATLKKSGMRPTDLELEITENILLEDEHITSETLRTFRAAGIKIALDDFGTGYSSLNYLKRYAVDRIKIDRSFVGQLPEDTVSLAIVQAMMTLAGAMEIAVTAEGVETAAQRDVLAALGCDTFQGYLYSPAIPVELVEELFSEAAAVVVLEIPRRTA